MEFEKIVTTNTKYTTTLSIIICNLSHGKCKEYTEKKKKIFQGLSTVVFFSFNYFIEHGLTALETC